MRGMLEDATSLNQDIESWDKSNLMDVSKCRIC
jgi:hypothetical protein